MRLDCPGREERRAGLGAGGLSVQVGGTRGLKTIAGLGNDGLLWFHVTLWAGVTGWERKAILEPTGAGPETQGFTQKNGSCRP